MALYLARQLNVPPASLPGESGDGLDDLPAAIAFQYYDPGCSPNPFRKTGWWGVNSGETFNARDQARTTPRGRCGLVRRIL
jgi:hypothetical protein